MPQLVIEGALAVASSMQGSETTVVTTDVSVTATTIVNINDWLRVDVSQRLSCSLFLNDEITYKDISCID